MRPTHYLYAIINSGGIMGVFDLDFSHLRAVVAPERIPLQGNEHRITRIAFDLVKLDEDRESLWQVQADDDGNEFLIRTYEIPQEDTLQTKSDWNVVSDSKKANLTISYQGIPVHRLIASEYGARTEEDVTLLCDLVKTKLSEDDFTKRMLATIPESKRTALAASFPKIASLLKQSAPIPVVDLTGSEEDPWQDRDLNHDVKFLKDPSVLEEAKLIIPRVLVYLKSNPGQKVSLHTLYMDLECNDIPLYLALHALVKSGKIQGISPYEAPSAEMAALKGEPEMSHKDFFYSIK